MLSSGLFLTADCLSEEKREGTLGFLFLTDLRGYDVVLGKLLSTSLRGVLALLAILPVLAIPLLMGGVTGAQFWNVAVALINTLFVSLTAGLFISAISRDSQKAMAGTLLALALLAWLGPAIDRFMRDVTGTSLPPIFSYSSPVCLFRSLGIWASPPFFAGLLVNQLVGWSLFALTCLLLPRRWQEADTGAREGPAAGKVSARLKPALQTPWWKFDLFKCRRPVDRKLLEVNPACWLACRNSWPAVTIWLSMLFLGIGSGIMHTALMGWVPFNLILYLAIASQGGRLFVESRRSGFLELLLSTPLSGQQIVQGQWRALLRMFGPALALFLAVQLVSSFITQQRTWRSMASSMATTSTLATNATVNSTSVTSATTNYWRISTTNTTTITPGAATLVTTSAGGLAVPAYLTASMALMVTLAMAANLVALAWFGMWMGLNSKNASLATLKTIVFVQVIPWFVIGFISVMMVPLFLMCRAFMGPGSMASQFMIWYSLLTTALATVLYLAKDLVFMLWARRKLTRNSANVQCAPLRRPLCRSLCQSRPRPSSRRLDPSFCPFNTAI